MDQRLIDWGSAMPGAYGITGANAWSAADKDEYFRLDELTERAEDEWKQEAEVLMRKNRGRSRSEWSKADQDQFDRGLIKRLRAYDPINRFYKEMKEKYKGVREKKKSIAEDATKSFVFEKLKYAPPRLGMPGGPGYEEAKASFGKGRTRRRHRKSRRTRKR
jgi:FMN phosphatase YigB (HAD superfamily)